GTKSCWWNYHQCYVGLWRRGWLAWFSPPRVASTGLLESIIAHRTYMGPWHAPLTLFAGHNYPSTPVFGVFMMTVFCMLSSPILSFITVKSRSIFPAAFFHGVMNGSGSLGIMIVAGGNPELLNGLTGLA